MEDILQKIERIKYERVNTFNSGISPCYYVKNDFGYVVFFIFPGGVIDLGIYDNKKHQVSLTIAVDQSIKKEWYEQFINSSVKNRLKTVLKRQY